MAGWFADETFRISGSQRFKIFTTKGTKNTKVCEYFRVSRPAPGAAKAASQYMETLRVGVFSPGGASMR
jgi:hypothetical protein